MTDEPQVVDRPDEGRLAIDVDGRVAELVYVLRGDRLILVHTGVPDELGGRGLGGRLVQAALDLAADQGLTIVPRCPFARTWLERHPEAAARASVDLDG